MFVSISSSLSPNSTESPNCVMWANKPRWIFVICRRIKNRNLLLRCSREWLTNFFTRWRELQDSLNAWYVAFLWSSSIMSTSNFEFSHFFLGIFVCFRYQFKFLWFGQYLFLIGYPCSGYTTITTILVVEKVTNFPRQGGKKFP